MRKSGQDKKKFSSAGSGAKLSAGCKSETLKLKRKVGGETRGLPSNPENLIISQKCLAFWVRGVLVVMPRKFPSLFSLLGHLLRGLVLGLVLNRRF